MRRLKHIAIDKFYTPPLDWPDDLYIKLQRDSRKLLQLDSAIYDQLIKQQNEKTTLSNATITISF